MDRDIHLLAPVEGLASFIGRGFTMCQIAAILARRGRLSRARGCPCHGWTRPPVRLRRQCRVS